MRIFKIAIGFRQTLYAQFNPILHQFTIHGAFRQILDIHVHRQICVPPNIDLICGFVLSFKGVSPTIPTNHNCSRQKSVHPAFTLKIFTNHNCSRQKSVHLAFTSKIFTFNTAVVTTVWAGQNFKWSRAIHSRA